MIHCNIVTFSIVIPFQINCKTHCNSFSCDDVLLKYHYYYYYYYYYIFRFRYINILWEIIENNFPFSPEFGRPKASIFRSRGVPGRLDALLAKSLVATTITYHHHHYYHCHLHYYYHHLPSPLTIATYHHHLPSPLTITTYHHHHHHYYHCYYHHRHSPSPPPSLPSLLLPVPPPLPTPKNVHNRLTNIAHFR